MCKSRGISEGSFPHFYFRLQIRVKKKKFNFYIPLIIIILALIGGGIYLFTQLNETKEFAEELTAELNSNTQSVYIATRYIEAGEIVTNEGENANVTIQQIRTGLESYNYLTADDMGKKAITDIPQSMPITYNMITDNVFEDDTREYEISVVNLTTDQALFDYVDIRIMFPNGEDYIILPKRQIEKLDLPNCIFTCKANEEEILRMSSAIIDAYTTTGAYIYSTKYVEGNLQPTAEPTYLVRAETIDLLQSDPNVLTRAITTLNLSARLGLEERIAQMPDEEKSDVEAGHGGEIANKGAATSSSNNEESAETISEPTVSNE